MLGLRGAIIISSAMAGIAVAEQYGAMHELEEGISPRYFLGSPQLVKRQSGSCEAGQHHCQDINFPSLCCPDDHYCYVDPKGQPGCCAIDSICDNPCPLSQYLCNTTKTVTGTATTSSGCCPRPCSAYTAYQCASTYGASCCSLGFFCTTSACVSSPVVFSTVVSDFPSGCTTGQFSCASSIGGGCCDNGATCTSSYTYSDASSNTILLCVSGTAAPSALRTGQNDTLISGVTQTSPESGLSTGAKAGIGAGIAVLGCLVIAGLLWFCMRRRKTARQAQVHSEQSESVSGIQGQSMSQTPRNASRPHGMTDYFGPAATAGPYTDHGPPRGTPLRGVPLAPDSPGDIVAAVEIGNSKENSNVTSPGEVPVLNAEHLESAPETTEHLAELP